MECPAYAGATLVNQVRLNYDQDTYLILPPHLWQALPCQPRSHRHRPSWQVPWMQRTSPQDEELAGESEWLTTTLRLQMTSRTRSIRKAMHFLLNLALIKNDSIKVDAIIAVLPLW